MLDDSAFREKQQRAIVRRREKQRAHRRTPEGRAKRIEQKRRARAVARLKAVFEIVWPCLIALQLVAENDSDRERVVRTVFEVAQDVRTGPHRSIAGRVVEAFRAVNRSA